MTIVLEMHRLEAKRFCEAGELHHRRLRVSLPGGDVVLGLSEGIITKNLRRASAYRPALLSQVVDNLAARKLPQFRHGAYSVRQRRSLWSL